MSFPLDVVQIGNCIVLIQGEVTPEFIKKLNRVDLQMRREEIDYISFPDIFGDQTDYEIRTSSYSNYNMIDHSDIVIDKRNLKTRKFGFTNYKIDPDDNQDIQMLSRMKQTLKYYKELMGY